MDCGIGTVWETGNILTLKERSPELHPENTCHLSFMPEHSLSLGAATD